MTICFNSTLVYPSLHALWINAPVLRAGGFIASEGFMGTHTHMQAARVNALKIPVSILGSSV